MNSTKKHNLESGKFYPAPEEGLIFNIQSHSVHDGPGTRTTVFFSGCPLNCKWCSNPEGLFNRPILLHSNSRCKSCGSCISRCPESAISIRNGQPPVYERNYCDSCTSFPCVDACIYEANVISGRYYSLEDLEKIFNRDRFFWGTRGGVTFSGGEPLAQSGFLKSLLIKCKQANIHTCVETSCHLPTAEFMEIMNYVDWLFADIKHMSAEHHKAYTGVDNRLIIRNIRALASSDWNGFIVPRLPFVPGFNDSEKNLTATSEFIKELNLELINILPFHRLGESKYRQLGLNYEYAYVEPSSIQSLQHCKSIIERSGIRCFLGHDTPF